MSFTLTLLFIFAFLLSCAAGWHLSDVYGTKAQTFDVETILNRCTVDESRIWAVHRTGTPDKGLPPLWNMVALCWTRQEVELFIIENVWGVYGERALQHRKRQSRIAPELSKLLTSKTYAHAA